MYGLPTKRVNVVNRRQLSVRRLSIFRVLLYDSISSGNTLGSPISFVLKPKNLQILNKSLPLLRLLLKLLPKTIEGTSNLFIKSRGSVDLATVSLI